MNCKFRFLFLMELAPSADIPVPLPAKLQTFAKESESKFLRNLNRLTSGF